MKSSMFITIPSLKLQQSSRSCHRAAAAVSKKMMTGLLPRPCRQLRCYVTPRTSSTGVTTNLSNQQQQQQRTEDADAAEDDSEGEEESDRWSKTPANFHPSVWGDFFLSYCNPLASSGKQTWMVERAHELKEEVAKMIARSSSTCSLLQRLHLVDALERLCLDHLFQEEINVVLAQISNTDVSNCDLQTVSLWFYLLRKHRYKVAPDVFVKFKDEEGSFTANNARDLLSLYNAAYLRTHGEIILDEAISFTKRSLESIMPYMEGSLARDIKFSLDIPLPRRVRIYEAKYYISTYEKEATLNETIMELAKLNSNLMQLHHQEELKIITRWWKDLQLPSRLSFARDRIVECYFWMFGVYHEPSYSRGRIILTKVLAIVSLLDDIYDVYGTSEECELFTKCIESWDRKAADYLPKYMKFVFWKILDTYESIDHELALEEKCRMSYLRNFQLVVKETAREAWTTLQTMHEGVDRVKEVRLQTLRSEFEAMKMGNNQTVEEFSGKFNKVINEIKSLGDDLKDEVAVKKYLRVLPKKFLPVVTTLMYSQDHSKMKIEEVTEALKAHEQLLKSYQPDNGEQALLMREDTKNRGADSTSRGDRGRGSSSGRSMSHGRGQRRGYT